MFEAINCPIFYKDFYKVSHIQQYPKGTTLIFSNFTPRKSRVTGVDHSVFFGLKYFIKKYLIELFNNNFFDVPEDIIMMVYKEFMKKTLGSNDSYDHIRQLHRLGYLPIAIHALPEGTVVPEKIPALVIYNTHPDFFWLTNALETLLSCILWSGSTAATTARQYRLILEEYAAVTSDCPGFVDYQAHDFSFRGLSSLESAMLSGAAHLNYFKSTDTIAAILFNEKYYGKKWSDGTSVPATEHSIMSAGGKENELETYRRLITEIYPSGIVSIVSDTWDLWRGVDEYLPLLKDIIMSRDGKVVIRPDSGNPVDIICGVDDDTVYELNRVGANECARKGIIECLWDIFGGTINSKGYKELDPHIGAIYGDSITPEVCKKICERLKAKGFASTNMVFGVGSYSYQYVTRDTLGWAMKATYAEINGAGVPLFKDPVTDNGIKKSAKGLLKVITNKDNNLELQQETTWDKFHQKDNELKLAFTDGINFL